jgi:DNA-3-methyladenine glycosylase
VRGRDSPLSTLARDGFAQPTATVARELIGCSLLVDAGTPSMVRARIVETEAYLGLEDPASHASRGPTPRAAIMFGEPGHLYVYLAYGVHHCANLVTEPDGVAGAVLLRAAWVEHGEAVVRQRRGARIAGPGLLRGPGNLCRGLALDRSDNGLDVCAPRARVRVEPRTVIPVIAQGPRVGVSVAATRRLRFAWRHHPAVSSPRPWPKP